LHRLRQSEGRCKVTPQQEAHLAGIKARFTELVDAKYRKGQLEHGGDLFTNDSLDLCDRALDEAIDQVVYLLTLRNNLMQDAGPWEKT
jgi:hypothetical protein